MAAMRCALAVVHDQQASLGATELRAHVAAHAGSAASQGMRLALGTRRASCIWQWMERYRANSLRPSPVRPPAMKSWLLSWPSCAGWRKRSPRCVTNGDDPTALLTRQSDLERQARQRAWKAAGAKGGQAPAQTAKLADLKLGSGRGRAGRAGRYRR